MSVIGKLFGHSPVRPMQAHMAAAIDCARAIQPFIDAMAAGDSESMQRQRSEIDRLEHQADQLKHEIRSRLPQRLFMAVERRDLLELLDCQDSIADATQDIAELATLRGMHTPEPLRSPLAALAESSVSACEQSAAIVNELDELIETGFGRREVERVEEMIDRLGELESVSDERGRAALRELFAIEQEIGIGSYYWYDLIRWLGDMADYAERAGNRIRLLIAS
jgi:predicted phosphate transport protein (TIGR00153 family)